MSRFFLAACFVLFSTFSAFSQEEAAVPKPIKVTPAVLAQVAETKAVLRTLPEKEQTLTLFQLLSLELQFDDKQPAKETVQTILQLVPKADKELTQTQLLEAAATAQAELGDFSAAVETLDKITKSFHRAEKQLNVVDFLLNKAEETKVPAPDVTGLLRKALAATVEAKDAGLEAFAAILLARELGKQGKTEELAGLFQRAVKKIAELEEVEGRNLFALLVRSGIQSGQRAEVQKLIDTAANPENKQVFTSIAAVTLVQGGKLDEGEAMLKTLPAGAARDNALMGLFVATVKTVSPEKIAEYIQQASSPEAGETLRRQAVSLLIQNDRTDVAEQLAAKTEFKERVDDMILARKLDKLVTEKKFDEAEKLADSFREEQNKFQAQRLLTISRLKDNYSEAVLAQTAAFLPEAEKAAAAELAAEAEKAAKTEVPGERFPALSQVLESQFQLFDLQGVQKTLFLMLDDAASEKDPAKKVVERLMLAQVQAELGDKSGVLKNLEQLQIVLDGTKDLQTLKGLVPEKDNEPETALPETGDTAPGLSPPLKLKLPAAVSENEIKDHIIEVYLRTANLLKVSGHLPQARAAFQKAKQISDTETEPMQKAEKMLALSRFLAEMEDDGEKN